MKKRKLLGLLKKQCCYTNLTACAIQFIKTVGADLYIRPKVESLHKENRRLSQYVNRRDIVRNHNMLANADITKCNIRSAPPNHGYRKRNG